tara:strand:- start:3555 stop:4025 length:471 start_codon:yes stop_codon:yes gene_type:complete
MFISLQLDQFDINNIFTSEKTKNNIMNNSDFYRLYFSDQEITTNGIYLNFTLHNITIDKYFNKIKCCFDDSNNAIINKIIEIEKTILDICKDININKCTRIEEQMSHNYIKIFDQSNLALGNYKNINILLKISGIWSSNSQRQYGLTFRFFINNAY